MILIFFLILFFVTIAWLLLPLIPAIREFLWPTDIKPLTVVTRETSDISFFAKNFRNYILTQSEGLTIVPQAEITPGALHDGTPFLLVFGNPQLPTSDHSSANLLDKLVVADGDTLLPDNVTYEREVYGIDSITGGKGSAFRAILSEKNLTIAPGSIILRWAHCMGEFYVMEDSVLYGRVSSDRSLCLAPRVVFAWISAPVISVGSGNVSTQLQTSFVGNVPFSLEKMTAITEGTNKHDGNLDIPAKSLVMGNLIITGNLNIGEGSYVRGSIKCYKSLNISDGVKVEGSIVAHSSLIIGKDCKVNGLLISEKEIIVYQGAVIGSLDSPSTISAPDITLYNGVVLFGMAIARHFGQTIV